MNYFDLWEASDASYLAVTFRSPRVRIGELFPPLRSRVGQWSKERLLYELAPGGFQAVDRDRVLTEELLKRSVTDDELLLLLKRREPDLSGTVLITIVSAQSSDPVCEGNPRVSADRQWKRRQSQRSVHHRRSDR